MIGIKNERWLKYWHVKREKGQLNYVISQTCMLTFTLVLFEFFIALFFNHQDKWDIFLHKVLTTGVCFMVVGLIFNYFAWVILEVRYQRLAKK